MGNKPKVTGNIDELQKLAKFLGTMQNKKVRIGIIGAKANTPHGDSDLTNADLGAVHEFGTQINHPGGTPYYIDEKTGMGVFVAKKSKLGKSLTDKGQVTAPHTITIGKRSFLWGPLKQKMNFNRDEMKSIKKLMWEQLFLKKTKPDVFFNALKIKALSIIAEAFNTGGFGAWKPLTANTLRIKAKKGLSPNILTATGQLKNSIDGKVVNNNAK